MNRIEEKRLEKMADKLKNVTVPSEKLHYARMEGLKRGRKRKVRLRRFRSTVAATAVLMILFVSVVRLSPGAASVISELPGMAPLVNLIEWDKGMEDVVKNNYFEELNIVQEKDGLRLTILGVTADEHNMAISYRMEADFDIQDLDIESFNLLNGGKEIRGTMTYGWFGEESRTSVEEVIRINSVEPIEYKEDKFTLQMEMKNSENTSFEVPFQLKKPIAKTKHFTIDEAVEIDGQRIFVKDIRMTPLSTRIRLEADPKNSMQILQVPIEIHDENGEGWMGFTNGVTSTGTLRDGEIHVYLESSYFRSPAQLTLSFANVEALPKGKDTMKVDFNRGEILSAPELDDVEFEVIENQIHVKVTNHPDFRSDVLGEAVDAEGNTVAEDSSSFRTDSASSFIEHSYNVGNSKNPVEIEIFSIPNYLSGEAELNIDIPQN